MNGKEHIRRAYESILENDFEQALAWFESAIRSEPDNAEYHHKIAITYARSGKLSSALAHAHKACALDPHNDSYKQHKARLLAQQCVQQAEKALDDYENESLAILLLQEAARLDPLCLEASLLLGTVMLRIGNIAAADAAVRSALKLDPCHEAARQLACRIQRFKDKQKHDQTEGTGDAYDERQN